MIELQEPSDLTVIPERVTPSGRKLSDIKLHCGLGFENMFDCFRYNGYNLDELKVRYYRRAEFKDNTAVAVVDNSLTDKFSVYALRVNNKAKLEILDTYAVYTVIKGEGALCCDSEKTTLNKGDSFFVTANSGLVEFTGNCDIIICMA